jgi:hypothetical protein
MNVHNKSYSLLVTAICLTTLSLSVQAARVSANSRGGSASASMGSRTVNTASGGSATWDRGSGTSVTTASGRSANTNATAYSAPATRRGYPPPPAYRPPVPAYGYHPAAGAAYYNDNRYSSGEVAAAGVAGLAVGAMVGSATAKNNAPTSSTVVVQQPAPAPTASAALPIGTNLDNLPSGCVGSTFNGIQYYQCGGNWVKTLLGSNGAYYQIVPAPY